MSASTTAPTATPQIALVGSPNSGKTSLFNALSGVRAKTANYPGVTVSRREADIDLDDHSVQLVDLPGTYGLDPVSPDEGVVADSLLGRLDDVEPPDALVIVADATSLDRSLFLIAEFLELDIPACLVLTMIDEVAARGGAIDFDRLSAALGIPVVGVVGHRGIGIDTVRDLLAHPETWSRPVMAPPSDLAERTSWVDSIVASVVSPMRSDSRTARIDGVLLHPVMGPLVFALIMLVFFQSIFTLATPMVDGLEQLLGWVSDGARSIIGGTLGDFVADGLIGGVGAVLVFLPQIALLFGIIGLLERVGYLARAALLADRVMGRFGLEGRSFVSMLSSFACAVPGIMSTRTIPDERHRLATMMAAPLMTCSARLPVFTLLIGAFVVDRPVLGPLRTQGLTLFGLYLLGAVSGLVYSLVLSRTMLRSAAAPFMMELPAYRLPTVRAVLLHVWDGAWSFMRKAGTVILVTTIGLWALLNVPSATPPAGYDDAQAASYRMEHSVAGSIGKAMEPVFAPLGFEWRTNVAILGSLAAREVFVSTLAVTTAAEDEDSLSDRMESITHPDGSPVYDAATVGALLVFFVYALQCFSTVAVLRRESNSWRWPTIAMGSMFALAYGAALLTHVVIDAVA